MNITFVENPKDDINHNDSRQNQQRLTRQGISEFRRCTGKRRRDRIRQTDFALDFLNRWNRVTERAAAAQIERDRRGWELALMWNGKRRVAYAHGGKRAQRNGLAAARFHINFVEYIRRLAKLWLHFQDHAELIQL